MIVNFKKDRFPIPAHQAIKGEFVLAELVGLDIHEPHSSVALKTGSVQQRIDPSRIQCGVPQLTLPQRFSPPLFGTGRCNEATDLQWRDISKLSTGNRGAVLDGYGGRAITRLTK